MSGGVMDDVQTTSLGSGDPLGRTMAEFGERLRAEFGLDLVALVANGPEGVSVLRASGVPIEFTQAVLEAAARAGFMVRRGNPT